MSSPPGHRRCPPPGYQAGCSQPCLPSGTGCASQRRPRVAAYGTPNMWLLCWFTTGQLLAPYRRIFARRNPLNGYTPRLSSHPRKHTGGIVPDPPRGCSGVPISNERRLVVPDTLGTTRRDHAEACVKHGRSRGAGEWARGPQCSGGRSCFWSSPAGGPQFPAGPPMAGRSPARRGQRCAPLHGPRRAPGEVKRPQAGQRIESAPDHHGAAPWATNGGRDPTEAGDE